MASRVELPKEIVRSAIEQKIASTARAEKAATNSIIKQALQEELSKLQTAVNTITEIK